MSQNGLEGRSEMFLPVAIQDWGTGFFPWGGGGEDRLLWNVLCKRRDFLCRGRIFLFVSQSGTLIWKGVGFPLVGYFLCGNGDARGRGDFVDMSKDFLEVGVFLCHSARFQGGSDFLQRIGDILRPRNFLCPSGNSVCRLGRFP
jgi:hypothetical protein